MIKPLCRYNLLFPLNDYRDHDLPANKVLCEYIRRTAALRRLTTGVSFTAFSVIIL
jgi:hypothetical protein